MKSRIRRLALCLGLVISIDPAGSVTAESPLENPPRVALVLSGGGARGGAHIGVLRVLEEANVQIDFIAGTSMGAIVGGLYAAGWSPDQIEAELAGVDWNDLLSDRGARRQMPFRRKLDDAIGFVDLEVGVGKNGVTIPSGLISGQKLGFLLESYFLETANLQSFDDLAIPYRAVAASLDTGMPVVFDRGSMPLAIRASMSLPVIFAPVVRNGETLVDGGIVLNMPVELALAAGATHIIAVNVSTPLNAGSADISALGVAGRMNSVMMQSNVLESIALLRDGDILITPDLEGISTADFPLTLEAADRGEVAARAILEQIQGMAIGPQRFDRYLKHQRRKDQILDPIQIDRVVVSGLKRVDERQLTDRIMTRPGSVLDLQVLSDDLQRLYEIGEFEQVSFHISQESAGNTLSIDVEEKPNRPGFMRFGLGLETQLKGSGGFSVFGDYTRTQMNAKGAEWQSFARIGDENSLQTEFYQPFDFDGRYFWSPRVQYTRAEHTVQFDPDERSLLDSKVLNAGLDLGVSLRNTGEIRFGPLFQKVDSTAISGPDPMIDEEVVVALRLLARFDTMDNAFFPTTGYFAVTEALFASESLGSDASFERVYARAGKAYPLKGKSSLIGILTGGSGLGSDLPVFEQFSLGGFLYMSGLEPDALRGDDMLLAQLVFLRELIPMPSIVGSGIYIGAALEAGRTWSNGEPTSLQGDGYSASGFVGLNSFVGPIYVGYGISDSNASSFYFYLGSPFRGRRIGTPGR